MNILGRFCHQDIKDKNRCSIRSICFDFKTASLTFDISRTSDGIKFSVGSFYRKNYGLKEKVFTFLL